jgi:protein-L-isoaspartate O-methyltransferase
MTDNEHAKSAETAVAPKNAEQRVAYTNVRTDIAELVPSAAIRILDVGCSNGALGGYLKSLVPQRTTTGIEIDEEFARSAESVLDHVIHASIEEIDLAEKLAPYAPFDCIICADVLEHLREPWVQLAALTALLDQGGSMVVSLPNIRHHSALGSIFFRGCFPRRPRGLFDSTHLRWFTFADGVGLLKSAGLRAETFSYTVRIGDRGGGLVNRVVGRYLDPVAGFWPIREFLVYQFAIRARPTSTC